MPSTTITIRKTRCIALIGMQFGGARAGVCSPSHREISRHLLPSGPQRPCGSPSATKTTSCDSHWHQRHGQ